MSEKKHTDMSLTDEQASLLGFKSLSMPEQYIQVKDVRYTLDEFNRIGGLLLGRNLTDDQQIAINNAKKSFEKGSDLYDCAIDMMLYDGLTDKEWAKVTVAFLLWALEQEEE